jgi:hypothetical protein
MLRDEDIQIDVGRADHGGNFMRLTHLPTGLTRVHPGPLREFNRHDLVESWLCEIESELQQKGLVQHIVPAYAKKSKIQRKHRT